MRPMERLQGDPHALRAFDTLFRNEEGLCGEFAVFYHSYSWAALLYEVRAAIAAVLFGFSAATAPLPRLGENSFKEIPNAEVLMKKVQTEWQSQKVDHLPGFRLVGISAMCSAVATGPECCLQVAFKEGYSCKMLDFRGLLESLLLPCVSDPKSVGSLATEIVGISDRYGLDTTMFGGQTGERECKGHILQIFVHRGLVDGLCYPAKPYGEVDDERLPLSQWLGKDHSFSFGQVRLVANPRYFMRPGAVRMCVVSSNEAFQAARPEFQHELSQLLARGLGDQKCRCRAARALGGRPLSKAERATAAKVATEAAALAPVATAAANSD